MNVSEFKIWLEALCAGQREKDSAGCHQSAPGAFGVQAATAEALSAKWEMHDGDWFCPVCARRRMKAQKAPRRLND